MCPILGILRRMTESQVQILMESFKTNPYPRKEHKHQLSESLNITQKNIEKWFDYMRHKKLKEGVQMKGQSNTQ